MPTSALLGEPRSDPWIEEVVTVTVAMPKPLRPVALAVLRAMATQK